MIATKSSISKISVTNKGAKVLLGDQQHSVYPAVLGDPKKQCLHISSTSSAVCFSVSLPPGAGSRIGVFYPGSGKGGGGWVPLRTGSGHVELSFVLSRGGSPRAEARGLRHLRQSFASLESQPRELHVAVRSYLGAAFAIALPRLSAFAEEELDHPPREFQPWKPKQGVCRETKIALYVEKFKLVIRYQSDRLKPQIYQNKRKGHVSYSKILYNHNS